MLTSTKEKILEIVKMEMPALPEDASEQDKLLHEFFCLQEINKHLGHRAHLAYANVIKHGERPDLPEQGQCTVRHNKYYQLVVHGLEGNRVAITVNSVTDAAAELYKGE